MTSKFEISSIIKRRTLPLTFVLGAASLAFAQQKTLISGEVTGPQNVKIPYASVNFINTVNKTASDAVLTGENGKYSLNLMPGNYTVSIEAIDFKKYTANLMVASSAAVKNFNIVANASSEVKTQNIEGVTITAQNTKPYRVELDKKIYDPATDLISKGGNLQDVLSNVPSISVDTDGTVSMRGNSNIKFLINGKPSSMLGIDEGSDALKSIPADQIERIEVITNPSSKFEASGTAGILNIILKKSKKLGFNGSVTGSVGYLPQTSLNTNLSWKRGAWSYFINGGGVYSRSKFVNNQEYRSLLLPENMNDRSTFYSKQDNDGKGESNSYNVTTGFVVDLTAKSALNASVMFRNFSFDSNDTGNYFETFVAKNTAGNPPVTTTSLYDQTTNRLSDGVRKNNSFQADLGFDQKIGDKGQLLTLAGSFQNSKSNNDSSADENSFTTTGFNSRLQNDVFSKTENTVYLGKADYELPIGELSKFEAGIRYDYTKNDYDYAVNESRNNSAFVTLADFTSKTLYTEKIGAAYGQFKSKIGKLAYQIGLRVENTNIDIDFRSAQEDKQVQKTKEYTGLFPSAFLSYEVAKNSQFLLNYSRRIQRPRSFFLVPFNSYNTRSLFEGNPDLNPTYENSFEFGYSLSKSKVTFNPTLYFKKSEDQINFYQRRSTNSSGGTVVLTTPVNAGSNENYGLDLNGSYDAFKWLRIMGSLDLYGYKNSGQYLETDFEGEGFSSRIRLTTTFKPDKNTSFQLQGSYRGAEKSVVNDRNAVYVLNAGASRTILKGDGTLAFNIQDVLNTRAREFTYNGPDYTQYSFMQFAPQQFTLSFTYRFTQGDKVDQPKRKKDVNSNFRGEDEGPM